MSDWIEADMSLLRFLAPRVPYVGAYESVRLVETNGQDWKVLIDVKIVKSGKYWQQATHAGVRLVTVFADGRVDSVRLLEKEAGIKQVSTVLDSQTPAGYKAREDWLGSCYRPGTDTRLGQRDGCYRVDEGYYLPDSEGNLQWQPSL